MIVESLSCCSTPCLVLLKQFRVNSSITPIPQSSFIDCSSVQVTLVQSARALPVLEKVTTNRKLSTKVSSEEEFYRKYVEFFNRPDIDGWDIRKGMADLVAMDLVPEPEIVAAALRACRRVNDFSLTTRFSTKNKIKKLFILICIPGSLRLSRLNAGTWRRRSGPTWCRSSSPP